MRYRVLLDPWLYIEKTPIDSFMATEMYKYIYKYS